MGPVGRADLLRRDLPAGSPVRAAVGRRHVSDKGLYFRVYLALSLLPVIEFPDRRRGIVAGRSRFILGIELEMGQHFAAGRAVELGDVLANGAGVTCGALRGLPIQVRAAVL